ncbi:MAG: amino acid ABC transporter permease [Anaerolineae bacterium]|nr:amino acid ABC transporter permease [Anaerolineae bacterium]
MAKTIEAAEAQEAPAGVQGRVTGVLSGLPWWLLIILFLGLIFFVSVRTDATYQQIFAFIREGVIVTLRVTIIAYSISITIGLLAGLGRVSKNPVIYNLVTVYVQVMRGLPILVTILYVSFVLLPAVIIAINGLGEYLASIGLLSEGNTMANLGDRSAGLEVSFEARAIIALAISYGAFSAEIFRAGIESIGRGQMEAARSLGMNYFQAMRHIILPQAVRRVLPPLGNDFIAMLKESSLVSALGVQDITQLGKLYSASSFQYLKTYNMVAVTYLSMTLLLSLLVKGMEKRLQTDG